MSVLRSSFRSALFAALCVGLSAGAWAGNGGNGNATVYKWVDAHGVIHYSDHPHPHAIKLSIEGAQTYEPPPPPPTGLQPPPSAAHTRKSRHDYSSCTIAQPHNQQMLMNVYHATAVVRTHPRLMPGNRIQLYLDGRRMPGGGPAFTFPVHRGQHSVSAVVVDSVGQIVCETSTVTFYVHQPSIKNPHNPVHPH